MDERQKSLLKSLPKIDEVLVILEKRGTLERAPREKVLETIRDVVAGIRSSILAGSWDAAAVSRMIPPPMPLRPGSRGSTSTACGA